MRKLTFLLIVLLSVACSSGPVLPDAHPSQAYTRVQQTNPSTEVPSLTRTATPLASETVTLTPTLTPSETVTASPTLTPSLTSTPPPTPVTWQLWFWGHTCRLPDGTSVGECGPAWTIEGESYFVISSDGTGLQALGGTGLPPTRTPYRGFLPPYKYYETASSPDDAYIAIILDGERLEIFPRGSEEADLRFKPELSSPGGDYKIDTLCWNGDSSVLRFLALQRDDRKRRVSFGVYTVRLDGSSPEIYYPPPGIEATVKGVCSPDGAEMIFANWSSDAGMAGLYKINLYTGEALPFLQGYHIGVLSTIPFR
jgi:hypothetical protein